MAHNYCSDYLRNTQLLLYGLNANAERLAQRGLSRDFIDQLNRLYEDVNELSLIQEELKTQLKEKNNALTQHVIAMNAMYHQAMKQIKSEIPQELWKDFGIMDQR